MSRPARAVIALGSNLGNRHEHLRSARAALGALPGTRLVAATRVEETAPLGGLEQPPYLNQMVLVETTLAPLDLLRALQAIETANGRERRGHWGSRTLDLDIVRYDDLVLATTDLTLPHPGVATRDFWQRELAELTPHER
ncbi:MAG TPA: 2-amino-4-hydroxy-6-hydroxymethyldihydropteridine diphosphokinase [Gemmatimonadales bacterium]|nr:2-amino-4-hydroxy-6-hydroxymethyldihydropteridine diphosphokinase [Gemmatimonadales bacterium]